MRNHCKGKKQRLYFAFCKINKMNTLSIYIVSDKFSPIDINFTDFI